MPNGKLFMWKAMRREAFNLAHCKTCSIIYNIDIDIDRLICSLNIIMFVPIL